MTRLSIVGGGPAATLHAEASAAVAGVELVGVGGRPGSAGPLADAFGVDDAPLDVLISRADAIVVAVPPDAVPGVLARVRPPVRVVLVESPVATAVGAASGPIDVPVMAGANLLHAPTVRRALRSIATMTTPHHLGLHSRGPAPDWGAHATDRFGGGAMMDPGARLLPVLLAAAGAPVEEVAAQVSHHRGIDQRAALQLTLADGRRATADIAWADGPAEARLEVADANGAVLRDLLTRPGLEFDGRAVGPPDPDENPVVALGFADQLRRLAAVARGDTEPWIDHRVGVGVLSVVNAAAAAAAADRGVAVGRVDPTRSPAALLRTA